VGYVDELYDAVVVQPIKRTSERFLWKTVDAGVIDGIVKRHGRVRARRAALLRLLQTGFGPGLCRLDLRGRVAGARVLPGGANMTLACSPSRSSSGRRRDPLVPDRQPGREPRRRDRR